MLSVGVEDFRKGITMLKLQKNAMVYMHSGLAYFGRLECSVSDIVDTIMEVIPNGTLIVPTYTNVFATTGRFDVKRTKSEMGLISEHIRHMEDSVVCPYSPFHSFAAIGKDAKELAEKIRPVSSFDENSIFAELLRRDAHIVLFGCDFDALTFLHYLEELLRVPYRFFKTFSGTIVDDEVKTDWVCKYYARDREYDVRDRFRELGEEFATLENVKRSMVGLGSLYAFTARQVSDYFMPRIQVDPLYLLHPEDRRYFEFNPTLVQTPLHHFDYCVRQYPNVTAVRDRHVAFTFADLSKYSFSIASQLNPDYASAPKRVGVLMHKQPLYVAAMLGIWRSQFTYVPFDPSYPKERLQYIIDNAEVETLITDENSSHGLDVKNTIALGSEPPAVEPVMENARYGLPSDIAYIIYTSGSTGVPKGVMITNDSFSKLIHWTLRYYNHQKDQKKILNIANFTFDQSMLDIAFMLADGKQVFLFDSNVDPLALFKTIQDEQIEIISTVPTTFGIMIVAKRFAKKFNLTCLKTLITGGAACSPSFIPELKEMFPQARIYNLYGPTEATVYCFEQRLDSITIKKDEPMAIGQPFDIMDAEILGQDDLPVKPGEDGELALRGPLVMRGYWKLPEQNKKVLIPDHARQNEMGHLYKTGDVAYVKNGQCYLKGRKDYMIKSSGYRIDLNEIELKVAKYPGCREVAAVTKPHSVRENTIILFYAGESLEEEMLRLHIAEFLPAYMQPHEIYFRESLPKNSSGKIDKNRLKDDALAL